MITDEVFRSFSDQEDYEIGQLNLFLLTGFDIEQKVAIQCKRGYG